MESAVIKVKVVPNSSMTKLVGKLGDAYKIKIQAPPEDGKANEALKKLLGKLLGVGPKKVVIEQGETTAEKRLRIEGVGQRELVEKLEVA